ncbi:MAG: tRNA pseudouridine(38-40) synthase TruA [Bacteroidia bacterium]
MNEMQRYFVELAYDGTAYHGWQRQMNAMSVQQRLEEAMSLIFGHPVYLIGQGRTDTGVHARQFFAHFDSPLALAERHVHKLNSYLPADLAILRFIKVPADAHARFSALSRTYEYHIHSIKDPFLQLRSLQLYSMPDMALMQSAANLMLLHEDFACFARSGGGQKTTICKLSRASWEQQGHTAVFTITANRFLRNMVRAVVGSLLEVGQGRKPISWFEELLAGGSRSDAGNSAAAHGLYLTEILYPSETGVHVGS